MQSGNFFTGNETQTGLVERDLPRKKSLTSGRVTSQQRTSTIGGWPTSQTTAQPSGEFQYVLAVLNVFSKELWARPLRTKTPAVVTEAFREILQGQELPSRLDTDLGSEFTGPFAQLLEEKDIFHVVKDPQDVNALAPLDRAIQTLKQSMFRRVVGDERRLGGESAEDCGGLQRDGPQRPARQDSGRGA